MQDKVKKISENRWVVTLEEDPVTGELVMPFPPEALAQAGWDFGDILEWKIDPDTHDIILKKKDE